MKIIEAMKELKLIEKKLDKNNELIQKYSSQLSNERLYFETKSNQEKEIQSLIQTNMDLCDRYLSLKIKIEKTNLLTEVELGGSKFTISQLLIYKRKVAIFKANSFKAMNDGNARQVLRTISQSDLTVERFYNEDFKQKNIRKWEDFYESIDSRLEVINATTDIIED